MISGYALTSALIPSTVPHPFAAAMTNAGVTRILCIPVPDNHPSEWDEDWEAFVMVPGYFGPGLLSWKWGPSEGIDEVRDEVAQLRHDLHPDDLAAIADEGNALADLRLVEFRSQPNENIVAKTDRRYVICTDPASARVDFRGNPKHDYYWRDYGDADLEVHEVSSFDEWSKVGNPCRH